MARFQDNIMKTLTSFPSAWRSLRRFSMAAAAAVFLAGCINHSETTYRDVERVKVQFENEKSGRLFYEALSKMHFESGSESHTEVSIPLVFHNNDTVKTGENGKFNEAVRRCDTNRDGIITETEAEIFAGQIH
jgi:hypothetical protein